MSQLAKTEAFTNLPEVDKVLPASFRILPKSSKKVSESFKVLPNPNKTSLSEQTGNSGDETHIRKIYESFAVLEDKQRSAENEMERYFHDLSKAISKESTMKRYLTIHSLEEMDEINTPEFLSSPDFLPPTTSSDEKTIVSPLLHDDVEFQHLDLKHEDHLALFCRERLNHVTASTLYVLLMEMRRLDTKRDMILLPKTINNLMYKYRIPLAPSLKHLHTKFRDERFLESTNYELMMTYLEARREERQRIGPEEIREWERTTDIAKQKQSKNNNRYFL